MVTEYKSEKSLVMSSWYVYMVKCSDTSLYTGVTTDLERRIQEHNHQKEGARYTRAKRPVTLVYSEGLDGRAAACKREAQIKKMSRKQKLQLVSTFNHS